MGPQAVTRVFSFTPSLFSCVLPTKATSEPSIDVWMNLEDGGFSNIQKIFYIFPPIVPRMKAALCAITKWIEIYYCCCTQSEELNSGLNVHTVHTHTHTHTHTHRQTRKQRTLGWACSASTCILVELINTAAETGGCLNASGASAASGVVAVALLD